MEDFFEQLHLAVGWTALRIFEEILHFSLPAIIDFTNSHVCKGLVEVGRFEVPDKQPVFSQKQRVVTPSALTKSIEHLRPHSPVPHLVLFDPVFLYPKLETDALVVSHLQSTNLILRFTRRREHSSDRGEDSFDGRTAVGPAFVGFRRIDDHCGIGFEEEQIAVGT